MVSFGVWECSTSGDRFQIGLRGNFGVFLFSTETPFFFDILGGFRIVQFGLKCHKCHATVRIQSGCGVDFILRGKCHAFFVTL